MKRRIFVGGAFAVAGFLCAGGVAGPVYFTTNADSDIFLIEHFR